MLIHSSIVRRTFAAELGNRDATGSCEKARVATRQMTSNSLDVNEYAGQQKTEAQGGKRKKGVSELTERRRRRRRRDELMKLRSRLGDDN